MLVDKPVDLDPDCRLNCATGPNVIAFYSQLFSLPIWNVVNSTTQGSGPRREWWQAGAALLSLAVGAHSPQ